MGLLVDLMDVGGGGIDEGGGACGFWRRGSGCCRWGGRGGRVRVGPVGSVRGVGRWRRGGAGKTAACARDGTGTGPLPTMAMISTRGQTTRLRIPKARKKNKAGVSFCAEDRHFQQA